MGNSAVPFSLDRSLLRLDREEPYLSLHFIMIFVRDQERSLRFYVDQLGFRLVVDHTFEAGGRWIEVSPPDGSANIALALATLPISSSSRRTPRPHEREDPASTGTMPTSPPAPATRSPPAQALHPAQPPGIGIVA